MQNDHCPSWNDPIRRNLLLTTAVCWFGPDDAPVATLLAGHDAAMQRDAPPALLRPRFLAAMPGNRCGPVARDSKADSDAAVVAAHRERTARLLAGQAQREPPRGLCHGSFIAAR